MQSAIQYLIGYYGLNDIAELYSFLREEIRSALNSYFPNPLAKAAVCVHIVNHEYRDQPVVIEGTLDLIADLELYSTCYPRKRMAGGPDW